MTPMTDEQIRLFLARKKKPLSTEQLRIEAETKLRLQTAARVWNKSDDVFAKHLEELDRVIAERAAKAA